jgi:hypothetical protein
MSRTVDCLSGRVLRKLVILLWLTSPLLVHAQGPPFPTPGDNPFATDPSDASPGLSSARSFHPYSGERSQIPPMQPEFAEASGFNWAQFFKSAAETGARLAVPRMFMNNGQSGMGDGSFFHAGSAYGTYGDSFNLSSRGVNFSTKSSTFDLHLSVQNMFANGFSPGGGGSSLAGSAWSGNGQGALGSLGGIGSMGGRDAQKGSGAKVSLQLKF